MTVATPGDATDQLAPSPGGRLTIPQGTALYAGAVLGTGVLALAVAAAGPASLVAWLGLVLLSVPLAATFAALGARYPDSGGVSTYVRRAYGHRAAAVVGWCFYFAMPLGGTASAYFADGYVADALGGGHRTVTVTAGALIAVVMLGNAFGVRVSGRVQLGLGLALATLLLVAVATALPHARLANLHPFAPHGWAAIGSAAALLVWSFAGWEAITHLAGEFRHPARDLPRATTAALVVVAVLYLGVAGATVLVLGPVGGTRDAPLAQLLAVGVGGPARGFAALAAVLMTAGTMNAYYAGAAKLGAALGRDGALPAWFARGSSTGTVPRRSLAVMAVLTPVTLAATTVAGVGPRPLVLCTTGSLVTVYVLGAAAARRLLPGGWARRASGVALVVVVGVLLMSRWYLLWPLGVTAAALLWCRPRRPAAARYRGRRPGPPSVPPAPPAGRADRMCV